MVRSQGHALVSVRNGKVLMRRTSAQVERFACRHPLATAFIMPRRLWPGGVLCHGRRIITDAKFGING